MYLSSCLQIGCILIWEDCSCAVWLEAPLGQQQYCDDAVNYSGNAVPDLCSQSCKCDFVKIQTDERDPREPKEKTVKRFLEGYILKRPLLPHP
jgi:hypothetical protein